MSSPFDEHRRYSDISVSAASWITDCRPSTVRGPTGGPCRAVMDVATDPWFSHRDPERALMALEALGAMGVALSIDDIARATTTA